MSKLQEEIKQKMLAVQQLERVKKHLSDLDRRIQKARQEEERLYQFLEAQYQDVAALEKMSLKSVFHKILGSKKEQVEQERQEYLQASLKYDEHQRAIQLLEYERKVLMEKWEQQADLKKALEKLLRQRERELLEDKSGTGAKLLRLHRSIEKQQLLLVEVEEAIGVGQDALAVLEEIMVLLRATRQWGKWPTRNTSQIRKRNSKVDLAREKAIYAQQLLLHFERELRDVYRDMGTLQLRIQVDHFTRFSDLFFDNLISDWVIQQRIQNAWNNVQGVRDRLLRLLEDLRNREVYFKTEIRRGEQEKQRMISG